MVRVMVRVMVKDTIEIKGISLVNGGACRHVKERKAERILISAFRNSVWGLSVHHRRDKI